MLVYSWFREYIYEKLILILPKNLKNFLFFRFDGVEPLSSRYILVQSFHVLIYSYTVFFFAHYCFTLNLFFAECMWFFFRRFVHIGKHVQKLNVQKTLDRKKTQKLIRLLIDYNRVHHDLIQINEFICNYIGNNFLCTFSAGLVFCFIELSDVDWRLVNLSR